VRGVSVVLGLDPAIGGGNAIIACALTADRLNVLDVQVDYALGSTEAQFEIIRQFATTYRPHLLIVEADAQQLSIGADHRLIEMGHTFGFTIRPHITRGRKADPVFGVASMDQAFLRSEISIPWATHADEVRMAPLVDQLRKWRPDKATRHVTQDAVMALWFVWRHWEQIRRRHEDNPALPSRPAWAHPDHRLIGAAT